MALGLWLPVLRILSLSVLFTWIYNNCGRSTLSAVFFYSAVNATGAARPYSANGLNVLHSTLAALVVVALFGRTSLTLHPGTTAA